jgi:hypothetical protein
MEAPQRRESLSLHFDVDVVRTSVEREILQEYRKSARGSQRIIGTSLVSPIMLSQLCADSEICR